VPLNVEEDMEADEEPNHFNNSNHIILKAALVKHFTYAYTNGQIHWPKSFSASQKNKMPLLKLRLNLFLALYLKPL